MATKPRKDTPRLAPESLMMGYGYEPHWSEGAIKPPVFLTSTFVFRNAEEGEAYFRQAYGLDGAPTDSPMGLIYSRLNNPVLEILEDRLRVWENAEAGATFVSGMAAITTTVLSLCRPGDQVAYSIPVYGGTDFFFNQILPAYGVETVAVESGDGFPERVRALGLERLRVIFVETPANPTTSMTDIAACAALKAELSRTPTEAERADASRVAPGEVLLAVDNTFMGPVFQQPLKAGADLSLYSATKFIGGHSDLVAGACLGRADLMERVVGFRTILGTMCAPFSAWLMLRSLETLKVRMEAQAASAAELARFLDGHPAVGRVFYPGLLPEGHPQTEVRERQCSGPGSLIAFEMRDPQDKAGAFRVLNRLRLAHLAVSLGGTETLVEHPAAMTHSDVSDADKVRSGITPGLIRVSCGLENVSDLIADFAQALDPEA